MEMSNQKITKLFSNERDVLALFEEGNDKGLSNELMLFQSLNMNLYVEDDSLKLRYSDNQKKQDIPVHLHHDGKKIYCDGGKVKFILNKDFYDEYFIEELANDDGFSIIQTRIASKDDDSIEKQFFISNSYKSKEEDYEYLRKYKNDAQQIIVINQNSLTVRTGETKYDDWSNVSFSVPQNFSVTGNTQQNHRFVLDEILKLEKSYPGITGYINSHISFMNQTISYCYEIDEALHNNENKIIDFASKRKSS